MYTPLALPPEIVSTISIRTPRFLPSVFSSAAVPACSLAIFREYSLSTRPLSLPALLTKSSPAFSRARLAAASESPAS